jgi:nucleoside-diphosphate-sugar epimerase
MTNNVLVTGATGFIGSTLIRMLIKQNAHVYGLIRNSKKVQDLPTNMRIRIGDITDPLSLIQACEGIDTIYHLAGFAHATAAFDKNDVHHQINFLGTKNLMTSAIQANVKKFVYFSSVKAVADNSDCINEQWDKLPTSPYGIAKRHAEHILLESRKYSSMHVSILRPALVYGPQCKGNLYSMLKAIDKGYFIPIPPINNNRSMISIHDVCLAAILAATRQEANGKIYFVTDGQRYSTHDIYTAMIVALGKKKPHWYLPLMGFKTLGGLGSCFEKILRRSLPINNHMIEKLFGSAEYDSTQIQRDLGFNPSENLNQLLPEMIAAYRGVNS